MRGGVRWKQGVDTCVFKPNVACKEDPVTYPRAMPNMISRVVRKDDSDDIEIELILKAEFPHLVERGFVAVHRVSCTPEYGPTNRNWGPSIRQTGACRRVIDDLSPDESLNLITPEYTQSYYDFISNQPRLIPVQERMSEALTLLKGAISAAIELVPDHGIWVVHSDLHSDNILVKEATATRPAYTAMADWGRSIAFNVDDPESIQTGLDRYLAILSSKFRTRAGNPFKTFKNYIDFLQPRVELYPQISTTVADRVDRLRNQLRKPANSRNPEIIQKGISALRGWMVYSLVKVTYFVYQLPHPNLSNFLTAKNQDELIAAVNAFFSLLHPGSYYTKLPSVVAIPLEAPPVLAAGPAAAGAGAGPAASVGNNNVNQQRANERLAQQLRNQYAANNARLAGHIGEDEALAILLSRELAATRSGRGAYGGKRKTRKQLKKKRI